jgi:hypothetical protein
LNLQYILLITISVVFLISSQNAYAAVTTFEWQLLSAPVGTVDMDAGNVFGTYDPVTLHIEDDDVTLDDGDTLDSITATITSITGDSITITLYETASGEFDSDTIIFMNGENAKFMVTDTATITIEDTSKAGNLLSNEVLIAGIDGAVVASETNSGGISISLTEVADTGIFTRTLSFCTIPGCSDAPTAVLEVTPGDIISILDESTGTDITNGLIIPSASDKGAIIASVGLNSITASYDSSTTDLTIGSGPATGRGGGGLIRPGLVIDAIGGLLTFGGSSGSTVPPTLGLDMNHKRIVDGGFSFNGNPVDVEQFYTPYPLITTPVGQNNTIKLKIYENRGPDNITHVGLSYGLGKGEIFNEGRATIEYDRTFDGIEFVTIFDPKHVLGSVNVTTATTNCSILNKDMCLEVTFDHTFRESLEYNMVATNIWDFQRNGWQNYFNHGIHIVGESMNPPEEYSGMYQGHIYHLIETGKNTAIDDSGNTWTFDKIWTRDYIKPVITDRDILNPNMLYAIEKLGFQYSDVQEIFRSDRMDHHFIDNKNQQQIEAQNIMRSLCPECQKESFEDINDIFFYDMPTRYSKLDDPQIITQIDIEDQKARQLLKEFFKKIYPGKVND